MKRQRLYLVGLMLALLLLVGACGGGDDETGGSGTTAEGTTAEENVSGSVSVIGVWTGPEQESFQAVIDGFTKETNIEVNYEAYASNEEMMSKLLAGATKYDLIQPSEYMIESLAKGGKLLETPSLKVRYTVPRESLFAQR